MDRVPNMADFLWIPLGFRPHESRLHKSATETDAIEILANIALFSNTQIYPLVVVVNVTLRSGLGSVWLIKFKTLAQTQATYKGSLGLPSSYQDIPHDSTYAQSRTRCAVRGHIDA